MSVAATTQDASLQQRAEQLLRDWPNRLAMIPTVKPLDEAWLPTHSPNTGLKTAPNGQVRTGGQPPHWWQWSLHDPTHLLDATCNQVLPDEFPYRNFAAMQAYRHTLLAADDLVVLAQSYQQTRDARCAHAVVELLANFAPHYVSFPITLQEEANPRQLRTHGYEICGRQYAVRVGPLWRDTRELQSWLRAYRLIRNCDSITQAQHDAVHALTVCVLETNALPNFLYFNDKYHNSLTNYYEVFILAADIWGQRIEVRDVVSENKYRGGDLAQLAINGPAGLRSFAANAFDREGVYWELSSSYTNYILNYLGQILPVLEGYTDPLDYQPQPDVAAFYEPIKSFSPARALPNFWRVVLSQIRLALDSGRLLPTNDSNEYRIDPAVLRRWGKWLDSSELNEAAQRAEDWLEDKAGCTFFTGSTLMAASGAVTLRGPANRLNVHLDWHRVQDYHSHLDPLNLVISAEKHTVLDDLGYHLGHPLRHILSGRTAAHNTVTVDEQDARSHGRGKLHHAVLDGHVQFIDASVDDAYAQCDLYRRSVVMMGDRYVVDLFRVQGGAQHDYTLLSRADESRSNLVMDRVSTGSLAHPDVPYQGFAHLDESPTTPAPPYEVMHHLRFARISGPFRVDWQQRDRPDLTTRVHHLPSDELLRAVFVRLTYQDRQHHEEIRTDEALLIRRAGQPGLRSQFVSVIETLSKSVTPLSSVQRLLIESPDPNAIAVRVDHEQGSDVIVVASTPGPHHVPAENLHFFGIFAAVCHSADQQSARVTMLGSQLQAPLGTLVGKPAQSARVAAIDLHAHTLQLDRPIAPDPSMIGQFIAARSCSGQVSHWRIAGFSADGLSITLDPRQSSWITLQGVIEQVNNPHIFTCGLRLTEPPILHSRLRIGPIGDFSAPRYALVFAQQTGLPLAIGGTTTTEFPRAYRMGLDLTSHLTPEHVGTPFWTCGIEIGDVVTIEPIVTGTLLHASDATRKTKSSS